MDRADMNRADAGNTLEAATALLLLSKQAITNPHHADAIGHPTTFRRPSPPSPDLVSTSRSGQAMVAASEDFATNPPLEFLTDEFLQETQVAQYNILGFEDRPRWRPGDDTKTMHSCRHCGLGFCRRYDLMRHLNCHAAEAPFRCEECQNKYLSLNALNRHRQHRHRHRRV